MKVGEAIARVMKAEGMQILCGYPVNHLIEFAAAEKGELPRLLEWAELKGSLHNHSSWSDGRNQLEEIAEFMQELGCAYWAITDHSKASFQANGLSEERVREQIQVIRKLNERFDSDFRFLTGTEVVILAGGKLDFPNDLLAELDVVVASVHQRLKETEAETTRRIIAAAD